MARTRRSFEQRSAEERRWLIENTWCDTCDAADLGLTDPVEYEEEGEIILEGKCRKCGGRVVSTIGERDAYG